jgi:hypothetical protein
MSSHQGTVDGRPAVVTLTPGQVSLGLDGRVHGPKSIQGSFTNEGKGEEWTIGLGTVRVRFVPDDSNAFNKALAEATIAAGVDMAGLLAMALEQARSFTDGIEATKNSLRNLSLLSEMGGGKRLDFAPALESLDRMGREHELFMQNFAGRGWALSPILENPWKLHVVAGKFLELGTDAEAVDDWLADEVIGHQRAIDIVGEIAAFPVRAIWQWAPLAGEAAWATVGGRWGAAATTWLPIAEGMWRDLRSWTGASKAKFYAKGALGNQRLTEILTRSRESLEEAHDYMSQSVSRTYLEPIDPAPTSRHALLHGRVAGTLRKVHVAKALTVVDAILEQASAALRVADPSDLEPPPWIDG